MPESLESYDLAEEVWCQEESLDLTNFLVSRFAENGIRLTTNAEVESFQRLIRSVTTELERRIDNCDAKGIKPRFRFSSVKPTQLLLQLGALKPSARNSLSTLVKNLEWRDFEKLCARVLQLAGLSQSHTFRGTKDGGLDIFGLLDPSSFLHPAIWRGSQLRVFAQVKKGNVSEQTAKQLWTDVQELQAQRGKAYAQLPKHLRSVAGPVLVGLFTAKSLTRGARGFGETHGFFLVDCDRLVELVSHFAAEFRGVTPSEIIDEGAFVQSIREED